MYFQPNTKLWRSRSVGSFNAYWMTILCQKFQECYTRLDVNLERTVMKLREGKYWTKSETQEESGPGQSFLLQLLLFVLKVTFPPMLGCLSLRGDAVFPSQTYVLQIQVPSPSNRHCYSMSLLGAFRDSSQMGMSVQNTEGHRGTGNNSFYLKKKTKNRNQEHYSCRTGC